MITFVHLAEKSKILFHFLNKGKTLEIRAILYGVILFLKNHFYKLVTIPFFILGVIGVKEGIVFFKGPSVQTDPETTQRQLEHLNKKFAAEKQKLIDHMYDQSKKL